MSKVPLLLLFISGTALGNNQIPGLVPYAPPPTCTNCITDNNAIDMPPIRTQDGLGLCYACSASAIIEQAMCAETGMKCSNIKSDSIRPSTLDLARFSVPPNVKIKDESNPSDFPNQISEEPGNYASFIIRNAMAAQTIVKESCAPLKQFVSQQSTGEELTNKEKMMWDQLHKIYDNYRIAIKSNEKCQECRLQIEATATAAADEVAKQYNYTMITSNKEQLHAFSQDTYAKFLAEYLIPDKCHEGSGYHFSLPDKHLEEWPKPGKLANFNNALDLVKSVIKRGHPIAIDVCLLETPTPKCKEKLSSNGYEPGGHSLVLSGIRHVCPPNSNDPNKCFWQVKVHNSWGEEWQKQNADGWVDAKSILDKTSYSQYAFGWIEDGGPK